jgi:peroxiredoxin
MRESIVETKRSAAVALMALFSVTALMAQQNSEQEMKAAQLLKNGSYMEAYKYSEELNKQHGGSCQPCLVYMALAKVYMGDFSSAMKLSTRMLSAATNGQERADALGIRGFVLLRSAQGNQKKLAEAAQAYRDALMAAPKDFILHLKIAEALFLQEKDEEGKKELTVLLAVQPKGEEADLASKWLADPRHVRLSMAPEFELTTLEGEKVSLKSLAGKVVLMDFWATWCPPCRASLPELKDLTKKFPAEKFTIVSVSADDNDEQWREFIKSHGMTWKQYRDQDRHVLRAFNVNAFPTYVLIDPAGFIRECVSGLNPQQTVGSRMKEPLKKVMEEEIR